MKNFEDVIRSRAVFILLELIENNETKDLVHKETAKKISEIKKI